MASALGTKASKSVIGASGGYVDCTSTAVT